MFFHTQIRQIHLQLVFVFISTIESSEPPPPTQIRKIEAPS